MVEAEAADVHAEEIEIIDDEEEGADSAASPGIFIYSVYHATSLQPVVCNKGVFLVEPMWQRRRPLMCMLRTSQTLMAGRRAQTLLPARC